MSLLSIWEDNYGSENQKALWQLVAMAGKGRVKDNSQCSEELRTFFGQVDADTLEAFAEECLHDGFEGSGFVLQDIVNEIGRRLEFEVHPGAYRGAKGRNGFDGIWKAGEGFEFVIEVKTTDTYNVKLDVIDGYRSDLISSGRLGENSSIVFVVGRQDTGSLEAQIRGSRHAWTMRVIGAASLIRLLKIKVKADSNEVVARIKALLRPVEYTRVDGIVDLMFDATEEQTLDTPPEQATSETDTLESQNQRLRTGSGAASAGIEEFRGIAADYLSRKLDVPLLRRRRSMFTSADDGVRAVVAVSKRYDRDYQAYWYALYESQKTYLDDAKAGYLVLGALDTAKIYVLPLNFISPLLPKMKTTVRDEGQTYWHIATKLVGSECRLVVGSEELPISQFEIQMRAA